MNNSSKRSKLVVVAGATGYLGGFVCRVLKDANYRVRALSRSDGEKAERLRAVVDEVFIGQATDAATLAGLCDGADVVVSSLGIRAMRGRPTFWDVDYGANKNVLECARQAGVEHFVFVSIKDGAMFRNKVPQVEARERVVDDLKADGPDYTIVCPTGFFNDMSEFFEMAKKGKVWLIGKGTNRINPIHGADLAGVVLRAIEEDELRNASVDAGGPEVLTMRGIAELAFEVLDTPPKIGRVPAWVLKFLGAISRPFSPNFSSFMKFFSLAGSVDAVAESTGTHHLKDFYVALRDGTLEDASALKIDRASV